MIMVGVRGWNEVDRKSSRDVHINLNLTFIITVSESSNKGWVQVYVCISISAFMKKNWFINSTVLANKQQNITSFCG